MLHRCSFLPERALAGQLQLCSFAALALTRMWSGHAWLPPRSASSSPATADAAGNPMRQSRARRQLTRCCGACLQCAACHHITKSVLGLNLDLNHCVARKAAHAHSAVSAGSGASRPGGAAGGRGAVAACRLPGSCPAHVPHRAALEARCPHSTPVLPRPGEPDRLLKPTGWLGRV